MNMAAMQAPIIESSRKSGRPKRKEGPPVPFVGFTEENIEIEYFKMPTVWINLCAEIDNLAELKIVQYIFRHTVGYTDKETGKPDYTLKPISTEEFMNGRKRRDGTRMDLGTGLSESAVKDGLERASYHGLIICDVDDRDRARIKKHYGIKMRETISQDEEDQGELINPSEVLNNSPWEVYQTPRSSKNELVEETREETISRKGAIRCIHPSNNNFAGESHRAPNFIQGIIEDLSRDFGDHEHTPSNITRAHKLYKASSVDPDTFLGTVYEARDKAKLASVKKVNGRGRPNRMPYFFSCLSQALQPIVMEG